MKFAVLLCRNAIALERSLIEVARQCPDLTVSIRLGDLIEANQSLVEEALMMLEKSVDESVKTINAFKDNNILEWLIAIGLTTTIPSLSESIY